MKTRMVAFRLLLLFLLALIVAVTVRAIDHAGLTAALTTFVADFDHPWRTQFYADLEIHLLLVACWIAYRERFRPIGFLYAATTMLLGALFTVPYILAVSLRTGGDTGLLLIGDQGRFAHDTKGRDPPMTSPPGSR